MLLHTSSLGGHLQTRTISAGVKDKVHPQMRNPDVIKYLLHFHVFNSELHLHDSSCLLRLSWTVGSNWRLFHLEPERLLQP